MRSYHTLLSIFSIVDQKYAVEGRLRPYSEVSRWTQAEITEVLEAGRNNDPSNRREEICDFFYVAYASFLWRKKGQTTGQEFLQVLASHPSFERYMSQLSEGDWTFALTKFQERNAYLFDESFLIKLKSIDTPTLVLDEIDLYWNKIKYLEQKGYKSPAYSDYEEMLSSLQGKEDVLRAFYTNPSDVASLAYIQACIQECKLGEPFSAYILRAITILPRCIHDYVVATETFQAQ